MNLFINIVQAHGGEGEMGQHMFSSAGFNFLGGIGMFLFWGLVVFGIIYLINSIVSNQNNKKENKNPVDILKERYAKGEIDKEEFEDKKKEL